MTFQRLKLRRVVLLVALAALLGGTDLALARLGFADSATWLGVAATLLAAFTVMNFAVILVFDLVLPRLGVVVAPIVYEILLAVGWAFATAVVLSASGVDLTGVVAASTIAAAILTISLQGTLGNVVGGIAVQFDGSLRAGDWVALDGVQGRVREIRWRHAVIETREGDAMIVPNAHLLSSRFTLLGRRDGGRFPHRLDVPFLVDVTVAPDLVVRAVSEALRESPLDHVAEVPPPECVCLDLGAQSPGFCRYSARVWLADLGPYYATMTRTAERVHTALRRAGIPLGAPTMGLYGAGPGGELEQRAAGRRRAEARRLLDEVPLLAPLTAEERDRLALDLVYRPYAEGEVITRQGAVAYGLYLVGEGAVRVVQRVDDRDVELAVLEAPALFGEMGLMTGEPRTANVVAAGPVVCWRLDKAGFDRVLRDRPGIAEDLSQMLAARRLAHERNGSAGVGAGAEPADSARILDRIRQFFGL